jgi:transcriptional pleiotropic repressor
MFNDICSMLSNILTSNVLILGKNGKLLGKLIIDEHSFLDIKIGTYINTLVKDELNAIMDTKHNLKDSDFSMNLLSTNHFENHNICVIPIICSGIRQGTLLLYKFNGSYTTEDIIVSEYGATIVGLEILRSESEESTEKHRKNSIVKSAISTLSYSELEAILHIFSELSGYEGLVIASKIADKVGITRSVIVNALRKLESAGVIESRSLGMKGTYIKVLNTVLIDELNKLKK